MNPKFGVSLQALYRLPPSESARLAAPPLSHIGLKRHRFVERACQDIVMNATEPLRFRATHREAKTTLGRPVSFSSIKTAVIRLAGKRESGVIRVRPGLYWHDQRREV